MVDDHDLNASTNAMKLCMKGLKSFYSRGSRLCECNCRLIRNLGGHLLIFERLMSMNLEGSAFESLQSITSLQLQYSTWKQKSCYYKHDHTSAANVIRIPRRADAKKVINRVHTSALMQTGVAGAFVDICREYDIHLLKTLFNIVEDRCKELLNFDVCTIRPRKNETHNSS